MNPTTAEPKLEDSGTAPETAAVTTDNLLLVGPGYSLEIPPAAETRKASLIATASAIVSVTTAAEAAEAAAEVRALAKIRNEIESGRKLVKEPILKLGRDIDAKAAEFGAELKSHEDRISGLVKDHALKVEEQRRAEQLRLQEIERQRIAAERESERQRAEEQRKKEEADRKAEEARLEAQRLAETAAASSGEDDEDIEAQLAAAAAIDAANAREKEARVQDERDRLAQIQRDEEQARLDEEARRASIAAQATTKGVSFPLAFEVEDIAALYAHDPSLVTLSAKSREITAKIKALEIEGAGAIPTIPGLRIFRDAKLQTR